MGTQFRSRLSFKDRTRIVKGIENAVSSIIPARKPRRAIPSIDSLSRAQVERLGNAIVRQVLTVADYRGFFDTFENSEVFRTLLKWIKELHNDAAHNEFQGIIKKYSLGESRNPVAAITAELEKLARKNMLDQHRVSASSAAKTVLAIAIIRSSAQKSDLSDAKTYSKALASFKLQDIVNRYIHSFVHEFIYGIVSMANPSGKKLIQDAVEKYTKGIAEQAVKLIEKENNLCNVERTHEILNKELIKFSEGTGRAEVRPKRTPK